MVVDVKGELFFLGD